MAELAPGTVIDGRYRVVSRLGSGGMADVFLAEDQQLGRKVALKLLHRRFAEDPDFVERFRREAQAAAGLQHPNVVGVYDRGDYDGTYYIAMEYLAGRSLKQLIRDEAPIDPVRAVDITLQILKAARFAHRHGVIHRDLKPHNAIVDESDHVKVTDFGIARAGASDMTETGSIMGTAQYLSPEQAQGHAVSETSDLYSVGVILYELLTGRVPFDAESAVTIALKHVSETPTAPTPDQPSHPAGARGGGHVDAQQEPRRPAQERRRIHRGARSRQGRHPGRPGRRADGGDGGRRRRRILFAAGRSRRGLRAGRRGHDPAGAPSGDRRSGRRWRATTVPPRDEPPRQRRRRIWPWLVGLAVLLLAGGGAAAYLLTRPTKVIVPPVVGQQLNTARTVLQNADLQVAVINVPSKRPVGLVIGELPQSGTKVDSGSKVSLTVSSGPGSVPVPTSIVGDTLEQAKKALHHAGLKPGHIFKQSSKQFPAGQVITTNPTPGQSVAAGVGTMVDLFVSSGPPKVNLPDVTGESEAQAKSDLDNAGFENIATTTTQTSSSAQSGTVLTQSPTGGSLVVPSATTVNLVIAMAIPKVSVPTVLGQSAGAATSQLQGAGFAVVQKTKDVVNNKPRTASSSSRIPTVARPRRRAPA